MKVESSYRTYEEWKLENYTLFTLVIVRSYRTYEEWKQMQYVEKIRSTTVLTVPMRNGNLVLSGVDVVNDVSSYRTYEEWKHRTP